jgi:hypothetical protein
MKSFDRTPRVLCLFLLVSAILVQRGLGQFDEMVKHIPAGANALVLVNAEKIFASAVAKSGGWEAQRGKRFESGVTCIPAKAVRAVIASQLDLETMRPQWDVAVIDFPAAPSLADIQQHFGGLEDTLGNTPALRVADDSYVVAFSKTSLGAIGPANRQAAASWLQQSGGQLSPYLQEAVGYVDAGTELILAIDAANALTPALVRDRLSAAEDVDLKAAKLRVDEVANIVSSLRGIMFGVTFGKEVFGKMKIDLAQDAKSLAPIAKPLVLAALANHGAMIDEMSDWKVQVDGTHIYLDGPLGESGLMRLSSMINLPTHAVHAPPTQGGQAPGAAAAAPPADPAQTVVETTQDYYKSVDRILADLRGRKGSERTIGQIGVWFGNYANKIDRLPILNVDEEMLQYGQYVAQQLRNASMAIKGYGINKRVAEESADNSAAPLGGVLGQSASDYYASGAYGGGFYGRPLGLPAAYGWARNQGAAGTAYWAGRSEMRQAFAARTQADVQLKSVAATSVQQILEQLREAHEKVRVDMTKKYNVEF